MSVDEYHEALDRTSIGVTASDVTARHLEGLDGSIVLCSNREAMQQWRRTHGLSGEVDYHTDTYQSVIEGISWEGVSYHMDSETALRFVDCLGKDVRFRPEVLFYESDGWTTVTSCFDPYTDSERVLREEIDSFTIGFASSNKIVGKSSDHTGALLPVRYSDLKHSFERVKDLDQLSMYRISSIAAWEVFWEESRDDG